MVLYCCFPNFLYLRDAHIHADRQIDSGVGAAQMGWNRVWAPCRASSSISRWEEIRAAEPQSRTETQHAKQQPPEHSAQLQYHLSGLLQPSHTQRSLSNISRIFNHKCTKSNGWILHVNSKATKQNQHSDCEAWSYTAPVVSASDEVVLPQRPKERHSMRFDSPWSSCKEKYCSQKSGCPLWCVIN